MQLRIQEIKGFYKLQILAAVIAIAAIQTPSAWAAEATMDPSILPDRLRFWPIQTGVKSEEKRDPYLAQAIENLPDYSYTQAGSVVATTHPITKTALWTKKSPEKPILPVTIPAANTKVVAPALAAPVIPDAAGRVLVLEGEASYYSRAGCLGCDPLMIMANGQPLNDGALTMAIGAHLKHLVGHNARVTSLVTGKSVTVRITDTGGFYQDKYGNRVADLTIATKQAIGMAGGVGQVRVEVF